MKRTFQLSIATVSIALLASLNSATVLASGTGTSGPVTVHKHVNFRGASLSVGEGDVLIGKLRSSVGNDTISSITIEPGYQVEACQHNRFRGRCETFTGSVADLRTISFNDVVSSLRVTKVEVLPVTLYQHVNYRGSSYSVGEGEVSIGDLKSSSVGNDRISSIKIEPGYQVLACQHGGFRGTCKTFENSASDLRTISFNDVISSLKVEKITSEPENEPPVANDAFFLVGPGAPTTFTLSNVLNYVDDPDTDDDDLTISVAGGDYITFDGVNTFTFDPNGDFDGVLVGDSEIVSFDYVVSDGQETDAAKINIEIRGTLNAIPVAEDLTLITDADQSLAFTVFDLAATDANGDTLTLSIPTDASLTNNGGTYTFDPSVDYSELPVGDTQTVSYQYTVSDGLSSATATLSIVVNGTKVQDQTYVVGDEGPGGGTVFSVSADGSSGLEFARDVFGGPLNWGCDGVITGLPYLTGFAVDESPLQDVQSGLLNEAILEELPVCSDAAEAAMGYRSGPTGGGTASTDWYLPSIVELDILRSVVGIQLPNATVRMSGPLTVYGDQYINGDDVSVLDLLYWSSTEQTNGAAWVLQRNGVPTPFSKSYGDDVNPGDVNPGVAVLPIRSF